ncbi:hypothetical protein [Methanolacinia petrolearia]|uniref:hypothetical protein n=1 Tax=Methanolacinia petrolearia TaxID=54120 RepID=UPI003BAC41D7
MRPFLGWCCKEIVRFFRGSDYYFLSFFLGITDLYRVIFFLFKIQLLFGLYFVEINLIKFIQILVFKIKS